MALNWNDTRPIGMEFLCGSTRSSVNPRCYFADQALDVSNLANFKSRALSRAAQIRDALLGFNAQGLLVWDQEGIDHGLFPAGQPDHDFTYVGRPTIIDQWSPEWHYAADDFYKVFTDAGLKIGCCLRPQTFLFGTTVPATTESIGVFIKTDAPLGQRYWSRDRLGYASPQDERRYTGPWKNGGAYDEALGLTNPAVNWDGTGGGTAANKQHHLSHAQAKQKLLDEIVYCKNRWGMKLFYVDTNVNLDGTPVLATMFDDIHAAHPDILVMPEWEYVYQPGGGYYASTAPYNEAKQTSSRTNYETPPQALYEVPDAKTFIVLKDLPRSVFTTLKPTLARGMKDGNNILGIRWFASGADDDIAYYNETKALADTLPGSSTPTAGVEHTGVTFVVNATYGEGSAPYTGHTGTGAGMRDGNYNAANTVWAAENSQGGYIRAVLGGDYTVTELRLQQVGTFDGWQETQLGGDEVWYRPAGGGAWTQAGIVGGSRIGEYTSFNMHDVTAAEIEVRKIGWMAIGEFRVYVTSYAGGTPPPPPTPSGVVWSATDKNAAIAVSSDGLTASRTGSGSFAVVRANTSQNTGDHVFSIKVTKATSVGVGLIQGDAALNNYMGQDAKGLGWLSDGYVAGFGTEGYSGPTFANADEVGFRARHSAGAIDFIKNGAVVKTVTGLTLGALFPAVSLYDSGDSAIGHFKASDIPFIPSGSGDWASSGAQAGARLTVVPGAYTLTGVATTAKISGPRRMLAQPGTYTLTGAAAVLRKTAAITPLPGGGTENPTQRNQVRATLGSRALEGYITTFIAAPGDLVLIGSDCVPVASVESTVGLTFQWPWPKPNTGWRSDFSILKTGAYWLDPPVNLDWIKAITGRMLSAMPFNVAASGSLADRDKYNTQGASFGFMSTESPPKLYVKTGPGASEWSRGIVIDVSAQSPDVATGNRRMVAEAGSYAITAPAAGLTKAGQRRLVANVGAYGISSPGAQLRRARRITAGTGTYTIVGVASALVKTTSRLLAASGSYTLTGQAATTRRGRRLPGAVGTYTLTGTAVTFATSTGTPVTLNPSDKSSSITLSSGNLRATKASGTGFAIARSTVSHNSGRYYFEMTAVTKAGNLSLGLAKAAASVDDYLGLDGNSYGYFTDGSFGINNAFGSAPSFTVGDVIGCEFDASTNSALIYKNGTMVGTTTVGAGTWFAAVGVYTATDEVLANFGASAFSFQPSGTTKWNA